MIVCPYCESDLSIDTDSDAVGLYDVAFCGSCNIEVSVERNEDYYEPEYDYSLSELAGDY